MRSREKPSMFVMIGGIILFLAFPASYGALYLFQFLLLFAIGIGAPVAFVLISRQTFGEVPPRSACLWPADRVRDAIRSYWSLMLMLAAIWLAATLVFADSIWALRSGLGDQWNPFTRTIHVRKNGPYSEYGIFDCVLFVSGFFCLSGFVWLPMYVFFERLTMSSSISAALSQGAEKA
jgi:hypothetical protein